MRTTGLDQYLYGGIQTSAEDPLNDVIEKYLDEQMIAELDNPDDPSIYVSGWTYGGKQPHPLYLELAQRLGVTPHDGSPHFLLYRDHSAGYLIQPLLMYWRKVNAVHRWFVENCQGGIDECQKSPVHPEALMDLLERCENVAADHDKAAELLPSQAGFFFGSVEYDDWYFSDIEATAKELKTQIAQCPSGTKFYYVASW